MLPLARQLHRPGPGAELATARVAHRRILENRLRK